MHQIRDRGGFVPVFLLETAFLCTKAGTAVGCSGFKCCCTRILFSGAVGVYSVKTVDEDLVGIITASSTKCIRDNIAD